MKSIIVFTSALSAKFYQDKIRKDELKESFKRAAKDLEMHKLAEEGLEDYAKQIFDI